MVHYGPGVVRDLMSNCPVKSVLGGIQINGLDRGELYGA